MGNKSSKIQNDNLVSGVETGESKSKPNKIQPSKKIEIKPLKKVVITKN